VGTGPSDVPASVARAVGHRDPAFLRIMDEVREMLRSTSTWRNVVLCLSALQAVLSEQGHRTVENRVLAAEAAWAGR
jgi:hypothetical protein